MNNSERPVWWTCPNGHPLGEVKRVNGVTRLMIYRPPTEQANVIAIITGSAEVLCYCGAQRHWQADAISNVLTPML